MALKWLVRLVWRSVFIACSSPSPVSPLLDLLAPSPPLTHLPPPLHPTHLPPLLDLGAPSPTLAGICRRQWTRPLYLWSIWRYPWTWPRRLYLHPWTPPGAAICTPGTGLSSSILGSSPFTSTPTSTPSTAHSLNLKCMHDTLKSDARF